MAIWTPKSDNGFAVEKPGSRNLGTFYIHTVPFVTKIGKKGQIAHNLRALAEFLHTIEPVDTYGWDGGYAYRAVRGGHTWSCHASGTAIDWNAAQHPLGFRNAGWTATQRRDINQWLTTGIGRAFTWGNTWSRPDPMHFQIASPIALNRYGLK